MSNHIPLFHVDVITYPCHNPDAGLPDLFIYLFFFYKTASHPGWGCGEQIQFLLLIIFHNHANTIFFAIYRFHIWQVSLQMTPVKYEWDWKDPTDTVCKIKMRNITHQKFMNDVTSMELMTSYGPEERPASVGEHLYCQKLPEFHYDDVIMGVMASQITSLAFVRGIHWGLVNSPHKWPVTRKMSPFDDVIMFRKMCITSKQEVWWYCIWKPIWNPFSNQILTESIICPSCCFSFLHFEFCTKHYSHISPSCAKS